MHGFTANLTEKAAKRLAANPNVSSVEQDRAVRMTADTQSAAPWGLDRIDQRALPLSNTYVYPSKAAGVTAYILDTGVRLTHSEFGGRATSGYDFMEEVAALLHDPAGAAPLAAHWSRISGRPRDFEEEERLARRQILAWEFEGQLVACVRAFEAVAAGPAARLRRPRPACAAPSRLCSRPFRSTELMAMPPTGPCWPRCAGEPWRWRRPARRTCSTGCWPG